MVMVQRLVKTNPLFIYSLSLRGGVTDKVDSGMSSSMVIMNKIPGGKNLLLKLYCLGV
jgi:hypothetical protein